MWIHQRPWIDLTNGDVKRVRARRNVGHQGERWLRGWWLLWWRKEAETLGGGCGVEIWWLRTEGEGEECGSPGREMVAGWWLLGWRKEAEALGGGCGVEIWWLRTEGEGVSGGSWRGSG
ncbi:hypothetical protein Acr_22g0008860 [Actinidia rufa]|uniref:Uncharacterized protein n=1 Tax=Actinidia rufa TaxID=165716 RepID=A0A7J0GL66_9ERIC|nr:hypothetical protein Acr_22g0008860 [Actinidia rufa]